MRFKGRMELEHGLKPIDIAPVINVIFLLLMFFMITPSFTTDSAITVNLPKAVTSEAVNYGDTQLVVSADNRIFLDGSAVTLDDLKGRLKAMAKRNLAILIKADSRANLGKIVEIWDTCKLMGIKQISIATGQQ
ncbi:MAG: biopolymer transporter ExbD [Candidatus Omnitrophica bacterium]|nr:biopolymer transporter ExbD [Candidatus Omnitrophota bacterium]MDD5653732.1 biopolymer transporter ExbD [Candidatus Omnitrophota bacterium]